VFLNPDVIAAASNRLDRKHGNLLGQRAARGVVTLPPDRLARVATYVAENRSPDDIGAFERAIGTNDLLPLGYFWSGLRAARAVGRILIAPVPVIPAARLPPSS